MGDGGIFSGWFTDSTLEGVPKLGGVAPGQTVSVYPDLFGKINAGHRVRLLVNAYARGQLDTTMLAVTLRRMGAFLGSYKVQFARVGDTRPDGSLYMEVAVDGPLGSDISADDLIAELRASVSGDPDFDTWTLDTWTDAANVEVLDLELKPATLVSKAKSNAEIEKQSEKGLDLSVSGNLGAGVGAVAKGVADGLIAFIKGLLGEYWLWIVGALVLLGLLVLWVLLKAGV